MADIREDEEQVTKEEETLRLLLTAGYFRARIRGLSTFDKIIGGMTWCIQGCNVFIDIDLLYNENANIGKKIALTERIVRALRHMKCPHNIEPHQIQGNDFIHVYPVIQWLVKQAIGSRDERMLRMRRLAINQFDRRHTNQAKASAALDHPNAWTEQLSDPLLQAMEEVQQHYKTHRKYRKQHRTFAGDERREVQTTLMEYTGRSLTFWQSSGRSTEDKRSSQLKSNEPTPSAVEDGAVDSIMNEMTEAKMRVANRAMGSILGQQSDDMNQMLAEYEREMANLVEFRQNLMMQSPQNLQKIIDGLQNQLDALQANHTDLKQQMGVKSKLVRDKQQVLQQKLEELATLQQQQQQYQQTTESSTHLKELQQLLDKHEQLKKQETGFKAACKEEMSQLQEEIQRLQEGSTDSEEITRQLNELTKQRDEIRAILQNARIELAKKVQESNSLERQLDEIPSQWEIQQYTRRLLELIEQLDATFRENRQLVATYNSDVDIRDCLQQEVELLNSIHENLERMQKNQANRDEFLQHMESVANSIHNVKATREKQQTVSKSARDQKKDHHLTLLELERQYARQVKDFRETLRRYEKLSQKAEECGIVQSS